jgi:hypothetical protein
MEMRRQMQRIPPWNIFEGKYKGSAYKGIRGGKYKGFAYIQFLLTPFGAQ